MLKLIDNILNEFKDCFTRNATFKWFVTIIIGLMIRTDKLGLSSIIRDLSLDSKVYESMIHFFRSSAWTYEVVANKWFEVVKKYAPLYREGESIVLVGDGVKQSKESRKMPGVKKLHQESENSSKAEFIFGHMFGGVGVLSDAASKLFCIPLMITLHDGVKNIFKWSEDEKRQSSHVVQIIDNAFDISKIMGNSILLLDRYFLSVDALSRLNKLNADNLTTMNIVTKAKKSCIAYSPIFKQKPGRGRPAKKGETVKLKELFSVEKDAFIQTTVNLYGVTETVQYHSVDLLWGQKLYQKLRFVLVKYKGKESILVSTDLNLNPESIIKLYSYRFKIECTFRELKQVLGGFSYQFWSKSMPKLNRYLKKGEAHPLSKVECFKEKERITNTIKAIEGYVLLSSISLGLLQILSITFSNQIDVVRYLRTPSKGILSEATIAVHIRYIILLSLGKNRDLSITKIIKEKQEEAQKREFFQAS
ncbi:transposase [Romboutsia sp.]|uniref:transposase n=1 Tax=Romboutsia sp. TaxID=1965302 RepID=UPI003F407F52